MALANYTDLISAINSSAGWLHRADLGTIAPDWVTLAEASMNYGGVLPNGTIVDGLRTGSQETIGTLTTVAGTQTVALPAAFLEMRKIYYTLSGTRFELIERPPTPMGIQELSNVNAPPTTFYVQGSSLYLIPIPDQAYTITIDYYASIGPLATSSTNWLMTQSPMTYLAGSIVQGALWMGTKFAMEGAQPWVSAFVSSIEAVRRADIKKRMGRTVLRSEAAAFQNRPFNILTGDLI